MDMGVRSQGSREACDNTPCTEEQYLHQVAPEDTMVVP